jgi:hypothetical protein
MGHTVPPKASCHYRGQRSPHAAVCIHSNRVRTSVRDFPGFGLSPLPPSALIARTSSRLFRPPLSSSTSDCLKPKSSAFCSPSSPARFERAVLRWHRRYCRETRDVTFDEGVAVLALLGAMRGPKLAASALADLLSRRGLRAGLRGPCGLGARGVELSVPRTRVSFLLCQAWRRAGAPGSRSPGATAPSRDDHGRARRTRTVTAGRQRRARSPSP